MLDHRLVLLLWNLLSVIKSWNCLWVGCISVLVDSWDHAILGIFVSFFFFSGVSVATCMAILHVGSAQQVRTGSTSSKEDDYESDAATIVQKCVSQASGHMGALIVQMRVYGQFFLIEERTWSTLHTLSPWVIDLRVRHSACLLDRLVDPAENTATLWWQWTL